MTRRDWLLFAAALAFLVLRMPHALTHGYMLAEEGTVYLRYAWDAQPLKALLAPHQSYYSLLPNVCGLLAARLLPLEWAGALMAWAALLVQLLLVYLVVRCEALASFRLRVLAVAVCLATAPTANMAFSTINAQYYFALCAGVVLLSDAHRLRGVRLAALALGGLDGVMSCILLPFFLWAAWKERTRERWVQAALLALCTVAQAAVVLHMAHVEARPLMMHSSPRFLLGAYLVNGPLIAFFTRFAGSAECSAVVSGSGLFWVATEASALAAVAVVSWIAWRGGGAARLLLAMAFFSAVAGLNGALAEDAVLMCSLGVRYFFICNIFTGLALGCAWEFARHKDRRASVAAALLLACLLVSGAFETAFTLRNQAQPPVWRAEVKAWRAQPGRPIHMHPSFWPDLVLAPTHANADLPVYVYDSNRIGAP